MSAVFFDDLGMPRPDIDLNIGSGSHADQTARTMVAFEQVCLERKPSLVVVAGDVNSTLACALTASKLLIPVAHVEAGLRSFDPSMPEEINRVLTDHISSLLFTTEPSGNDNLLREGISRERIHFVGNSMIDSLRSHLDRALAARPWDNFGLEEGGYGLITLHRPANVDDLQVLSEIGRALTAGLDANTIAVPGASADSRAYLSFGSGLASDKTGGAAGVSGISRLDGARSGGFHRLRRRSRGNNHLGCPMCDHTAQYGAPDHDRTRHE